MKSWIWISSIIDDLHAAGIKVNCWTVDDPDRAKELIEWGVDMITTNILEGSNVEKTQRRKS